MSRKNAIAPIAPMNLPVLFCLVTRVLAAQHWIKNAMHKHPLENVPCSFPVGKKWFAFYTHIHRERLANDSIAALGFEVFTPFEKRVVRKANRKPRIYEAALFPRYGFVRFDPNDHRWGKIMDAKGVVEILTTSSVPRSVPDQLIDGLRLAVRMGNLDKTKPPEVGMRVEATDGPFVDWVGKILRSKGKERARVLFSLFGATREVEMPLTMLRVV